MISPDLPCYRLFFVFRLVRVWSGSGWVWVVNGLMLDDHGRSDVILRGQVRVGSVVGFEDELRSRLYTYTLIVYEWTIE